MHVVGVPVATGYKRGLSKQVAKTKVFDQKRLETIQDQMHDFVEQQMKDVKVIGYITKPDLGAYMVTRDNQEMEIRAQGWNAFTPDSDK